MYNNYGAPGFGRPPPNYAPPPGMVPPGMAPPGAAGAHGPPGVTPPNLAHPAALGGPRQMPPFQAPPNMPNINFNAPVIRLGTSGPPNRPSMDGSGGRRDNSAPSGRRGLGMDSGRDDQGQKGRDTLIPPTREEIARTIFVGNIPQGLGDNDMERILAAAGTLRRFTRVTDANNKPQTFGFAEYEDAESLETAAEIFKEVYVPTKRPEATEPTEPTEPTIIKKEEDEDEDKEDKKANSTKLQVMVDDASIKYADEWKIKRGDDEATTMFRIDSAKNVLSQVITSLFNPPAVRRPSMNDVHMTGMHMRSNDGVEVVQIPLNAEDELADIPAEMRETVAAEIAAFRDRSNKRDLERLKREEEIEAEQRRRDRRSSPPAAAPTGPGGAGANGVPLGPRADRGIPGVPSGPKGGQFPRDYQGGVSFVNGGAVNNGVHIKREDDDESASDSELENRRLKKRDAERDTEYKKVLNQWLKYESRSANTLQRTAERMRHEDAEKARARDSQAKYLAQFDDDIEVSRRSHLYYRDREEYMRDRIPRRDREAKYDAQDRAEEKRELAAQRHPDKATRRARDEARSKQEAENHRLANEAQPFKLSLGAATKKIEQTSTPRRTAAEVENLLEDEELVENPASKKRTLVPINFDAAVRANLTAEEIAEYQTQLALEIPYDKEGLWAWNISWDHLPEQKIDNDIRNWAENKILVLLGMQEDMLVDVIINHLKSRGNPDALVENLEVAIDEEAEALVRKLWRMIIYYSEVEKRGIK